MTTDRRNTLLAAAVLAAVPTILFFDVLAGTGVFYLRDVVLYHFPSDVVIRRIVASGEFPYWNPFFSSGLPLAANPANQLFYPLKWLILLPNFVRAFQMLVLVHVYLATFTTFAFVRSLGASRTAAMAGAISFGIGGYVMSTTNLFPFLFSAAWVPLTCLFGRRFLRERRRRDFVLAAGSLAMQLLVGEPVTLIQTAILLGVYCLMTREARGAKGEGLLRLAAIGVVALLIAAVQILPAIDHVRDSVRARGIEFDATRLWSTPPMRVLETVYPDLLGSARADSDEPYWGMSLYPNRGTGFLLSLYPGLLIVALATGGVAARLRGWLTFVVIVAISFVLAIGDHTPLLRLLYDAGVMRSIRYPEKFVLLGLFSTSVFGALSFDALLRGDRRVRRVAIAFAATSAAVAAILAVAPTLHSFATFWHVRASNEMFAAARHGWIIAAIRGTAVALLLALAMKAKRQTFAAATIAFVALDLYGRANDAAPRVEPSFFTQPPPVVQQFAPDRDTYRIFNMTDWSMDAGRGRAYFIRRRSAVMLQRNALLGRTPAMYGLRIAVNVDFDETSLAVSREFDSAVWELNAATRDWLNYVVAMSNVRYIGIYQDFGKALAAAHYDARLVRPSRYVEGKPMPRYYFAPQVVTARDRHEFVDKVASGAYAHEAAFVDVPSFVPAAGRVLRVAETPNRATIDVEADGTAYLVISVTPHRYWNLAIDGTEVPAIRTNIGYQGVVVPRGRHVVTMRYSNPLIAVGGAISLATLLALVIVLRMPRRIPTEPSSAP